MLKIAEWSKYQSYKDRRPPWIRFHRTMLDNYKYQKMSADSRALLPMLWLLACEDKDPKSGLIQLEIEEISFRIRQQEKTIKKCIDELQDADFIECIESVTKPLRECNETVPTETETEAKKRQRQNIPYQSIVDIYNNTCSKLPRVAIITDKRKRTVKEMFGFKENHDTIKWWEDYFKFVSTIGFLNGENDRGWFADFDWILNKDNFVKIIEGKYK
jgi:hypothetical protein